MDNDRKKYGIVFLITLGIFIIVFGLVNLIDKQKIENIDDLQRKITVDLIATETQFDLLKTAPCGSIENTILSQELQEFGEKLSFAQDAQGVENSDVQQLKKYYSLLQVKDYLLMEEFAGKCDLSIDSLLYFYSSDCEDCTKQGYVLTELKKQHPEIRIYSFDTELDFSVIDTFISLYNFEDIYPTIIVNEKIYQEFVNLEELEVLFPELLREKEQQIVFNEIREYIIGTIEYSNGEIIVDEVSENEFSFTIEDMYKGSVIIDTEGEKSIEIIEL